MAVKLSAAIPVHCSTPCTVDHPGRGVTSKPPVRIPPRHLSCALALIAPTDQLSTDLPRIKTAFRRLKSARRRHSVAAASDRVANVAAGFRRAAAMWPPPAPHTATHTLALRAVNIPRLISGIPVSAFSRLFGLARHGHSVWLSEPDRRG